MRYLHTAVASLGLLLVGVEANSVTQFKQRSLVDVCGNVNADLNIGNILFGRIELCLCASALPNLIQSNAILSAAASLYGQATVTSEVNNMLASSQGYKECAYPDNSVALCTATNVCGFTCTNGFLPSPLINPTACICPAPFKVCNGVCGVFLSCASPKAKRDTGSYPSGYVKRATGSYPSGYVKRDTGSYPSGYVKRDQPASPSHYVKRDAEWRDSFCPHGWSACRVFNSASAKFDYECVDVRNDLWSCGGCGIPLLPDDPVGTDCSAIPGVMDVACVSTRCIVSRCKKGFFISEDKSTCLALDGQTPAASLLVENGRGPYNF
ncbi:hypothetical protein M422DRAFT_28695 [Sphaerobolus stellatus SS14]|uniref:Protein CPL1-like domain-containing protein n=1 Tax=Sphaerobolus stellatus (strain SS14) TaxID=990650 RepID=A0A0C9VIV5_SPHS4|nr:hypothetical protein M422DRAFT_28695 [Sphaerobolus stellatus SS14]